MHISLNYLSPFIWVYPSLTYCYNDSNPAGIDFNAFDKIIIKVEFIFLVPEFFIWLVVSIWPGHRIPLVIFQE